MRRSFLPLLAFGAFLLSAVPGRAQSACWTAIPSDGTVDETDEAKVVFTTNRVSLEPSMAPPQTAVIRYNVVAVEGVLGGPNALLHVNYVDAGGGGQVIVRLKDVDFHTGVETTLATMDSNAFPSSAAAQTRIVASQPPACSGPPALDFGTKMYYVEVTMKKTGTSDLKLRGLKVCTGQDPSC